MRCYQECKIEDKAKAASEKISGIIISDEGNSRNLVLYSFEEGESNPFSSTIWSFKLNTLRRASNKKYLINQINQLKIQTFIDKQANLFDALEDPLKIKVMAWIFSEFLE